MDDEFVLPAGGEDALLAHWRGLFPDHRDPDAVERAGRGLLARYAEKQRAYHNASHVLALVRHAASLSAGGDRAVALAVWFHDAVYKPMLGDNEERSAVLAADVLGELGADPALATRIGRFVLATKTHALLEDSDALRTFLDCDLAILGAREDVYERYTRAVRREYQFVPAPLYRRGRRKVLLGFLARPALYFTPAARERFETAARANVTRELAGL